MSQITPSFGPGDLISQYTVKAAVKVTERTQCYRVKSPNGRLLFVKLLDHEKLSPSQLSPEGTPYEVTVAPLLDARHSLEYVNHGKVTRNGRHYWFIAYNYISGIPLRDYLSKTQISVDEVRDLTVSILHAVAKMDRSMMAHCAINPDQVMVVPALDDSEPQTYRLVGLSHCHPYTDSVDDIFAETDGDDQLFTAPEILDRSAVTDSSDLYSCAMLMYWLLFKNFPTEGELSLTDDCDAGRTRHLHWFMREELKTQPNERNSIIKNLVDKLSNSHADSTTENDVPEANVKVNEEPLAIGGDVVRGFIPERKTGNGFADVAGMTELKARLQSDVIDLLQQPEQAKALGLKLPNGLLFYGPPGCGKTYFAEKFAEQAGLNYLYVKCSDIASPYIHGGQSRIAAIFARARKAAPCIIFLDEIDAMITSRSQHQSVSESGEVNVFLTELNNCGDNGVVVIGATNKPEDLDEAALRAGRLEKKYYIGEPDDETRRQIFDIALRHRNVAQDIDLDRLASLTPGYVSADIRLIVDTAARIAFAAHRDNVSMADLEEAIAQTPPSLTREQIKKHEQIRDRFTHRQSGGGTRKAGFDTENARTIERDRKIGF